MRPGWGPGSAREAAGRQPGRQPGRCPRIAGELFEFVTFVYITVGLTISARTY